MIACPGCGANLTFDIESQQMHCAFCGEHYDPYAFDSMEKDAEKEKDFDAWVYRCPQCGAELMTTEETDATAFCPYCGGTSLLFDKLRKEKRPDYIIPFQLSKEQCKQAYRREARKAIFTPAKYKRAELVDSFRGIYMPYWSYRVEQKGDVAIDASGSSYRDGDYVCTPKYEIRGQIDNAYEGVSHDASRAFDDEISECLEPYDVLKRLPFTPGFLSGFYADVADESPRKYRDKVKAYAEQETARQIFHDAGVRSKESSNAIRMSGTAGIRVPTQITRIDRVFYPVWFMSYREGDKLTYATVNGQTGKVVADFPISPLRFLLAALLCAALLFLPLNFFLTLKPETALITTTALLLAGVFLSARQYRALRRRFEATDRLRQETGYASFLTFAKIMAGVGVLVCAGILIAAPVYNLAFYIPCLAEAAFLFLVIFQTFRFQMKLAMRRPPQFNKTGGNDHA